MVAYHIGFLGEHWHISWSGRRQPGGPCGGRSSRSSSRRMRGRSSRTCRLVVGVRVGPEVGVLLGFVVGKPVGLKVGVAVGLVVGVRVGVVLGRVVGVRVGVWSVVTLRNNLENSTTDNRPHRINVF